MTPRERAKVAVANLPGDNVNVAVAVERVDGGEYASAVFRLALYAERTLNDAEIVLNGLSVDDPSNIWLCKPASREYRLAREMIGEYVDLSGRLSNVVVTGTQAQKVRMAEDLMELTERYAYAVLAYNMAHFTTDAELRAVRLALDAAMAVHNVAVAAHAAVIG